MAEVVGCLCILVLLGVGARHTWGQIQQVRAVIALILDTPTTPAGQAREGFTEVSGKVRFVDAPLLSPLGETPCAVFEFKVEEQVRGGRHAVWRERVDDGGRTLFAVEDASGTVLVDPAGADVELEDDCYGESGFFNDAPPEVTAMLSTRYGLTTKGLLMNRSLRYRERCLQDGDDVYVFGLVVSRNGRPTFVQSDTDPFYIADRREGFVLDRFRREEATHVNQLWMLGGVAALIAVGGLVSLVL